MTDEEILKAVVEKNPDAMRPLWMTLDILNAYRLGWEARGKRDAEVCRSQQRPSMSTDGETFTNTIEQCALAIEREGKR